MRNSEHEGKSPLITRRQLLRGAVGAGGVAIAAGVLVGCGGESGAQNAQPLEATQQTENGEATLPIFPPFLPYTDIATTSLKIPGRGMEGEPDRNGFVDFTSYTLPYKTKVPSSYRYFAALYASGHILEDDHKFDYFIGQPRGEVIAPLIWAYRTPVDPLMTPVDYMGEVKSTMESIQRENLQVNPVAPDVQPRPGILTGEYQLASALPTVAGYPGWAIGGIMPGQTPDDDYFQYSVGFLKDSQAWQFHQRLDKNEDVIKYGVFPDLQHFLDMADSVKVT